MLKTPLCVQLGVEYPIFSAGMGLNIAGPELTAAVSNAGGCGVLGAGGLPAEFMVAQIRAIRALTDKPFGVNIILPLVQAGQIEACFDERVPFIVFFWGDPSPYLADARRRGIKVFIQVGSVEESEAVARAGVDAIIAQGNEAGGHVKSKTALSTIVPAIAEAVRPIPVIASGGIANGRGLVAALSLGAQAVSMGTRFLASPEARVTESYKDRVVQARAEDTVYTRLFDIGWPDAEHRVLRTADYREWEAAGAPPSGARPGEGSIVGRMPVAGSVVEMPKYTIFPPLRGYTGDIEHTALYAGESCRLVHDIKPAGQIVRDIVAEAEAALAALRA